MPFFAKRMLRQRALAERWHIFMDGLGRNSPENVYLQFAGVLLALTALAKLYSAAGEARILAVRDPVLLLLSNRGVLMAVGLLELATAGYLIFGRNTRNKHVLIIWLSLNFIVYRVGLWWVAPGKPCPCLGTLTERLPLAPDTVDLLLKLVIVYLLGGSLFFLLLEWLRGPGASRADQVQRAS
ncbi:MAG: hypothetical protein N3I86_00435 [Verrucomicrobiae bacterium]|nr:hypothetical protein [Verrucomicrobiae bacterium]